MYPTGSLTVVSEYISEARRDEKLYEAMLDNACWNTAIALKLCIETAKVKAGLEFLLWILARLQLPDEPNPWNELQEKLTKEKTNK